MAKQMTRKTPAIETMNIGAAAVDIGLREHMAAVNPDVTDAPVRAFGTFTHDLHEPPRVYRRVKPSTGEPYDREEIYPRLSCRAA